MKDTDDIYQDYYTIRYEPSGFTFSKILKIIKDFATDYEVDFDFIVDKIDVKQTDNGTYINLLCDTF